MNQWPFADPPNVATFTVAQVMNGTEPILLVTHDQEDGAWQFLPGGNVSTSDAMVVGLAQMVNIDSSLNELADLPLGWKAYRSGPEHPWQREPVGGEENG